MIGDDFENWVVSGGIGGHSWATYRRMPTGSLRRVVSPHLPLRTTRKYAMVDLWVYLERQLGGERGGALLRSRAAQRRLERLEAE